MAQAGPRYARYKKKCNNWSVRYRDPAAKQLAADEGTPDIFLSQGIGINGLATREAAIEAEEKLEYLVHGLDGHFSVGLSPAVRAELDGPPRATLAGVQGSYRKVKAKITGDGVIVSAYRGVSWDKGTGCWEVQVRVRAEGLQRCFHALREYHDDEVTAASSYDRKSVQLFGSKAKLNFGAEAALEGRPMPTAAQAKAAYNAAARAGSVKQVDLRNGGAGVARGAAGSGAARAPRAIAAHCRSRSEPPAAEDGPAVSQETVADNGPDVSDETVVTGEGDLESEAGSDDDGGSAGTIDERSDDAASDGGDDQPCWSSSSTTDSDRPRAAPAAAAKDSDDDASSESGAVDDDGRYSDSVAESEDPIVALGEAYDRSLGEDPDGEAFLARLERLRIPSLAEVPLSLRHLLVLGESESDAPPSFALTVVGDRGPTPFAFDTQPRSSRPLPPASPTAANPFELPAFVPFGVPAHDPADGGGLRPADPQEQATFLATATPVYKGQATAGGAAMGSTEALLAANAEALAANDRARAVIDESLTSARDTRRTLLATLSTLAVGWESLARPCEVTLPLRVPDPAPGAAETLSFFEDSITLDLNAPGQPSVAETAGAYGRKVARDVGLRPAHGEAIADALSRKMAALRQKLARGATPESIMRAMMPVVAAGTSPASASCPPTGPRVICTPPVVSDGGGSDGGEPAPVVVYPPPPGSTQERRLWGGSIALPVLGATPPKGDASIESRPWFGAMLHQAGNDGLMRWGVHDPLGGTALVPGRPLSMIGQSTHSIAHAAAPAEGDGGGDEPPSVKPHAAAWANSSVIKAATQHIAAAAAALAAMAASHRAGRPMTGRAAAEAVEAVAACRAALGPHTLATLASQAAEATGADVGEAYLAACAAAAAVDPLEPARREADRQGRHVLAQCVSAANAALYTGSGESHILEAALTSMAAAAPRLAARAAAPDSRTLGCPPESTLSLPCGRSVAVNDFDPPGEATPCWAPLVPAAAELGAVLRRLYDREAADADADTKTAMETDGPPPPFVFGAPAAPKPPPPPAATAASITGIKDGTIFAPGAAHPPIGRPRPCPPGSASRCASSRRATAESLTSLPSSLTPAQRAAVAHWERRWDALMTCGLTGDELESEMEALAAEQDESWPIDGAAAHHARADTEAAAQEAEASRLAAIGADRHPSLGGAAAAERLFEAMGWLPAADGSSMRVLDGKIRGQGEK